MYIKIVSLILISFFVGVNSYAQMPLKTFVNAIDWDCTESQFVYTFRSYVEPSKHEFWKEENSESNFCLKNIFVGKYEVVKSYIRISRSDKKLFRINLIMILDGKDINEANEIMDLMVSDFGEPLKFEKEKSNYINQVTKRMQWETLDYKMMLSCYDFINRSGIQRVDLIISLEPLF